MEVAERDTAGLRELAGVSGAAPVFDHRLLATLRWASNHYVAPLSVVLEKATPPNLPKDPPGTVAGRVPSGEGHPLAQVASAAGEGRRSPAVALVGRATSLIDGVAPAVAGGGSALVIVATAAEVETIDVEAPSWARDRLVAISGDDAAALTRAWEAAQGSGRIVVGTPRLALWSIPHLAMAVVVEEGRRAMKDRQTPTVHVRDLLFTRSRIEGFSMVVVGPTPTLETLASGAEIRRLPGRAWGLVEVVDRNDDPPGSGYLSPRVVAALEVVVSRRGRAFVFTHRRVGDASMRCEKCRRVRRCGRCGSRLGRVEACPRCGADTGPCRHCGSGRFQEMGTIPDRLVDELERRVGPGTAGVHPTTRPIAVGTERDLAAVEKVDLAVAADADALALGQDYRAEEEALRVLARLVNTVGRGEGRRLMLQTSMPGAPLMTTLRSGDPVPYLERLLGERVRLGLPPASEMLAIEVRGLAPEEPDQEMRGLGAQTVMGPAPARDGWRWLLQGRLGEVRIALRPMVQKWREKGASVRIDADPIDL